jgi:hypothetical protein
MIKVIARLPSSHCEKEVVKFVWRHPKAMAELGASQAQTEWDRKDIWAA